VRLSTLIWITIAALLAALFSQLLGWEAIRTWILIVWAAFLLLLAMTRGMRWTGVLTYLSVAALVGAVACQLAGWQSVRGWFLLAWAALLLPVAIGLFSHPMRGPAWGLFVGFWGVVGALWLIVLQLLVVAGVLGGEAYRDWAAWPVGLVGLWFFVASSLGFGAERFPRGVDALGMAAGAGLILISIATWTAASPEMVRTSGFFAAVMYCLYAVGLGWVFWGTQDVTHRFRGLSTERAVSS
jgi:hypothetical protein